MAAELVHSATSEKLAETDWMKNIQICELVAHDQRWVLYILKVYFPTFFGLIRKKLIWSLPTKHVMID